MRKGQGRRPLLDASGLQAICEHSPEAPLCPVDKDSFKMDCFKVEVFYGQTSPNLPFLLEITDAVSSGLKSKEIFQHVISIRFKNQHLRWYGGA